MATESNGQTDRVGTQHGYFQQQAPRQQMAHNWAMGDDAERVAGVLEVLVDLVSFEIRRLRAGLPSVNLERRLNVLRERLLGDHRNAIRALADLLPYRPRDRVVLDLNNFYLDDEFGEADNRARVSSLVDVIEVAQTLGPLCGVRHRCEYFAMSFVSHQTRESSPDHLIDSVEAGSSCIIRNMRRQPRESTPMKGMMASVGGDASALFDETAGTSFTSDHTAKIESLEQQLTELRLQMAAIIKMKMTTESKERDEHVKMDADDGTRAQAGDDSDSVASVDSGMYQEEEVVAKPRQAAPAPPPPPPPPPPPMILQLQQPSSSSAKSDRLPAKRNEPTAASSTAESSNKPSLTEMLKGLGSVKLRKIERSPGGTPRRREASDDALAADPGAFIAAALRKKFKSVGRSSMGEESPSSGKENDLNSSWDSSPERQPPSCVPKRRKMSGLTFSPKPKP
uniref:Mitochondrial fission regulator 2 n=1 Tax=Plectus sambesii TaxID=2011161 RepID=A0A914W934_9BILA